MSVDVVRLPNGVNVPSIQLAGAVFFIRYSFTNNTGQAIRLQFTDDWNDGITDLLDTVTGVAQPAPGAAPGGWLNQGFGIINLTNFSLIDIAFPSVWSLSIGATGTFDVGVRAAMMGTLDQFNWSPSIAAWQPVAGGASTPIVLGQSPSIEVIGNICVHEQTLVKTQSGVKRISEIEAGERCYDASGQLKRVERNVCSGSTAKYVRIQRNALGKQQPSADLLIARGHPLLLNGKEVPCEELIDGRMIDEVELEQPARLFTLATEGRGFVEMQGLLVGTWSHASLENFQQNDVLGTMLRLTEQ